MSIRCGRVVGGAAMRRWFLGSSLTLAALAVAVAPPGAAAAATRPAVHSHPLVGVPGATTPRALGAHAQGTITTSYNWSGYDDSTDGPFTTRDGYLGRSRACARPARPSPTPPSGWASTATTPTPSSRSAPRATARASAGYDAWYEMYPLYPVTIDMAIRARRRAHRHRHLDGAGELHAHARRPHDGKVRYTSGAAHEMRRRCSPRPRSSPRRRRTATATSCRGADFGIVRFSGCSFDDQPIGTFDWNRIDMVSETTDRPRRSDLGARRRRRRASASPPTSPRRPPTVLRAAPAGTTRAVTVHFEATDNRGGQGVAYTEYSLDGGATWTRGDVATVRRPGRPLRPTASTRWSTARSTTSATSKRSTACSCSSTRAGRRPVANWRATARRGARTAPALLTSPTRGPAARRRP